MPTPYVGECRLVGFTFAPKDWAICDGSVLAISEYQLLFDEIGTLYGGDGQNTFQLPDLQGRVPIHQGTNGGVNFYPGQAGGTEQVLLDQRQIPVHSHPLLGSASNGTSSNVQNTVLAGSSGGQVYRHANPILDTPTDFRAVGYTGRDLPHENRQPFLVLNWIISLFGIET
jgi:microcystin-dependent protein